MLLVPFLAGALKPLEFPQRDSHRGVFCYVNEAALDPTRLGARAGRTTLVIRGLEFSSLSSELEIEFSHQWPVL